MAQDFGFKNEMSITEGHVIIMIGKPRIEEAIEGKAVFSLLAMSQIVEQDNFIQTINLTQQAKQLASECTTTDKANPLHLVTSELRIINGEDSSYRIQPRYGAKTLNLLSEKPH